MSDRSIRRAAERQAFKAARKDAARQAMQSSSSSATGAADAQLQPKKETSEAKVNSNRANSQHSSGPKSSIGKAISCMNALKTALTGVTVLLPSDDLAVYQAHILSYEKQFKPVGPEECALTQSIADLRWRLNRIPALEIALLTLGHKELAETNPAFAVTNLTPILEMEIRRIYVKDFRNLHLQESRLARRREKEMAELKQLQADRKSQEKAELAEAVRQLEIVNHFKRPFRFEAFGFEISKERFLAHLALNYPNMKYQEDAEPAAETMEAAA